MNASSSRTNSYGVRRPDGALSRLRHALQIPFGFVQSLRDKAVSPGRPGATSSFSITASSPKSPTPATGRLPAQSGARSPHSKRCQATALQRLLILLGFLLLASPAFAHHFKGLPHYNYFENYPQIPEEEFLGQADPYEFSLVVYDFQGINREVVETPDNVRLFLVIFNLKNNVVYGGPLTLDVLDHGEVVHTEKHASSELENLYGMHRELPGTGKYALRVTLHDQDDLVCTIPFTLSSQKVHWGKWIGGALLLLIVVAAVGARRARVKMDRKAAAQQRSKARDQEENAST